MQLIDKGGTVPDATLYVVGLSVFVLFVLFVAFKKNNGPK